MEIENIVLCGAVWASVFSHMSGTLSYQTAVLVVLGFMALLLASIDSRVK